MDTQVAQAQGDFRDSEEARKQQQQEHDDLLEEALDDFDDAVTEEADNRTAALDDLRFARLSQQWPDKIRLEREQDGRPCLTLNKLPTFIRNIVNEGRQNRPSVKVRPADSQSDPRVASIYEGLIRNIEYTSSADVAYDTGLECAVDRGFGYWRVATDYSHDDAWDLDIVIKSVPNPFTVYGDPDSKEADSSDWNRAFVTEMLSEVVFERKYKGAEKTSWKTSYGDTLRAGWREEGKIRVAEWWKRYEQQAWRVKLSNEAILDAQTYVANKHIFDALSLQVTGTRQVRSYKVVQRIVSGAEILEENPWPGRFIPIVSVVGDEINEEGKRHKRSLIRDAKDPQRMHNYWRTTSTEVVALAPRAPWIGAKGAFKTDKRWATANVKNYSTLEYDPVPNEPPPQRQPFAGVPAGALQEALNASDDMKAIMGIFDPSLGSRSNETSGIAIRARQRESDVANFHFVDNQRRSIRHTGRILIDLIPKIYTGARIVRVLGPDAQPSNVPVNQQIQLPDGTAAMFDLTAGKYDLVVESGPSYATRRAEATDGMLEFMRAYPPAAPMLGDLLAKNLDWPDAEEVASRLRSMLPAHMQGQGDPRLQAAQQAIQQLQQQLQQGGQAYAALQQELLALRADREAKLRDSQVRGYQAETDRLEAVAGVANASGAALDPMAIQAIVLQTLSQVLRSPDILVSQPQAVVPRSLPMMGAQGPMSPQGMSPQGMPPQGPMSPQGMPPQGMPPQSPNPAGIAPQVGPVPFRGA
jgi:hypothetical protein